MIFPTVLADLNTYKNNRDAYKALRTSTGDTIYSNWTISTPEPNNSGTDEAFLTILYNNANGVYYDGYSWNDRDQWANYPHDKSSFAPHGYLVEFGDQTNGNSTPDDETNLITVVATVGGFDAGEIDDQGQTICQGDAVTEIGNEREAKGGQGEITYKWQLNNDDITGANGATYTPEETTPGVYTYTRWAKADKCETTWKKSTGTWVLTINPILTAPTSLTYDEGAFPHSV